MSLREALASLAVALASGLLVGAEREQARTERDVAEFGGIRTFPLISLAGALGALAIPAAGPWPLVTLLVGIISLLAVHHARAAAEGHQGMSTEVAALLVFMLGAAAAMPGLLPSPNRFLLVASASAAVMTLLTFKRPLHGFVSKLSTEDTYATAKFVIVALVLLPLLPNQTFGPLSVLNPFQVGVVVVLTASVSFAGYVASRIVGEGRGLLVTGLFGGLASSTAVTFTFAQRAREAPGRALLAAVAIGIASAVSIGRVLVLVALVDAPLVRWIAAPVAAMGLAASAAVMGLYLREVNREQSADSVPLKNPFALRPAIQFGLLYAAVLVVSKAAEVEYGTRGIYASAVLAGLTQLDAITLSLAELHRSGLAEGVAARALTLAVATNTVAKVALAWALGGAALGRWVALTSVVVLAAGAAGYALGGVAALP